MNKNAIVLSKFTKIFLQCSVGIVIFKRILCGAEGEGAEIVILFLIDFWVIFNHIALLFKELLRLEANILLLLFSKKFI